MPEPTPRTLAAFLRDGAPITKTLAQRLIALDTDRHPTTTDMRLALGIDLDISHIGDAPSFDKIRAIHKHLWTQDTQLYQELKAISEGNGTLWDHTLIVHWNELAQGNTHQTDNSLVVLAGKAHNFFRTGRYVDLSNAPHNSFSDFLTNCHHYMGFNDVMTFGDPRLSTGAPVTGLT